MTARTDDWRPLTASTHHRNQRHLVLAAGCASWVAGGVGYVILEGLAASAFRPQYSYAHNHISDLGVTSRRVVAGRVIDSPLACLMNLGFYLQGALFFVGAVLVARALAGRNTGLFVTLAATNAIGNLLVGTVHSGPVAEADGVQWMHGTGAVLAIVGGNAAILTGSSLVARAGGPRWYRIGSLGLAVLGLLSFTLFVVDSKTATINMLPAGVWERGSVYTIIVWQILTAAYLLARR